MDVITAREWNFVFAAHLLRRAGFTATPDHVDVALSLGPSRTVDLLLDFPSRETASTPPFWVKPGADTRNLPGDRRNLSSDEREELRRKQREERQEQLRILRAWWLDRMAYSPRPLEEKMTLFWHGHFATSAAKVQSPYAMYQQNEMFRSHAAGNWRALIHAVSRDPAMLIYLDQAQSNKNQPNENFARELMELFTLGEGRYTEDDVRASARAFTGHSIEADRYAYLFREGRHDKTRKKFMGKSGRLKGDDIIDTILEHPQAAWFICRKLAVYFVSAAPPDALVHSLADILRRNRWELKPVLRALFMSRAFYLSRSIRQQIKSPVEWLIGSALILGVPIPPDHVTLPALSELGQELFAPPNVKGWDGGPAWINTVTLTRRQEYAERLVLGMKGNNRRMKDQSPGFAGADPFFILPVADRKDKETAHRSLIKRFFQGPVREKDAAAIKSLISYLPDNPVRWHDDTVKRLAVTIMKMPAYQLT